MAEVLNAGGENFRAGMAINDPTDPTFRYKLEEMARGLARLQADQRPPPMGEAELWSIFQNRLGFHAELDAVSTDGCRWSWHQVQPNGIRVGFDRFSTVSGGLSCSDPDDDTAATETNGKPGAVPGQIVWLRGIANTSGGISYLYDLALSNEELCEERYEFDPSIPEEVWDRRTTDAEEGTKGVKVTILFHKDGTDYPIDA